MKLPTVRIIIIGLYNASIFLTSDLEPPNTAKSSTEVQDYIRSVYIERER